MNGKLFIALCCVAVYGCLALATKPTDEDIKNFPTYMERLEKINMEEVFKNDRVFTSYLLCLLNEGPCVQQSRDMKKVIPVISHYGCIRCTDKQLAITKKSLNYVRTKKPVEWTKLVQIYDPTGYNLNRFIDN